MKNVLITGGAGFVGRHLALRCLQEGYRVVVVDDLSTGTHPLKWMEGPLKAQLVFVQQDVRDFFQHGVSKDYEMVFHCAAIVGGRLKIDGDPIHVATDLAIDSDFFNWVVRLDHRPQRIIYFSSSAVYPTALQTKERNMALSEGLLTIGSERISMPDQTYGWAKLTGEVLAHHAVKMHNSPIVIYRPFSGYGGDQSADYPFPAIIRRVLARESPVVVWGSGHQVRDFIHIDDVVDCVFETKDKLQPGETLNIGTGTGIAFRQLAETACRLLDHGGPVQNDITRPEGVYARVADIYNMQQLYRPRIGIEEGIRRVADELRRRG